MSDSDDRLARLEAKVDQLTARVEQLTRSGGGGMEEFDRPANMYPPTSER